MKKTCLGIFTILFVLTQSHVAYSATMTEVQLFYRCYAHITNTRPASDLAELASVTTGVKTAAQACMDVFNRANLVSNSNTRINNTSDEVAVSVLDTFHSFHSSWFGKKDFKTNGDDGQCMQHSLGDLYDSSTPALYFTRALFESNTDFSTSLSGETGVEPIRADQTPSVGAVTQQNSLFYNNPSTTGTEANAVWAAARRAPIGALYGVQTSVPMMAPPMRTSFSHPTYGIVDHNLDLKKSFGGGLLGTQAYLLMNSIIGGTRARPDEHPANGAIEVSRNWSKAVYEDLLCRSLPLVRLVDAEPFVVTNSTTPFRTAAACTQCHVSMDQTAYAVRNLRTASFGQSYSGNDNCEYYSTPKRNAIKAIYKQAASESSEGDLWLSEPDEDFYKRPAFGRLYYRGTEGKLVNKRINGIEELGQALLAEDDVYICAAKRYLKHFTGFDANVDDLNDPLSTTTLNAKDQAVRDYVISLGKSLRSHQDLSKLVEDIIKSSIYKDSTFQNGGE